MHERSGCVVISEAEEGLRKKSLRRKGLIAGHIYISCISHISHIISCISHLLSVGHPRVQGHEEKILCTGRPVDETIGRCNIIIIIIM